MWEAGGELGPGHEGFVSHVRMLGFILQVMGRLRRFGDWD